MQSNILANPNVELGSAWALLGRHDDAGQRGRHQIPSCEWVMLGYSEHSAIMPGVRQNLQEKTSTNSVIQITTAKQVSNQTNVSVQKSRCYYLQKNTAMKGDSSIRRLSILILTSSICPSKSRFSSSKSHSSTLSSFLASPKRGNHWSYHINNIFVEGNLLCRVCVNTRTAPDKHFDVYGRTIGFMQWFLFIRIWKISI